MQEIDKTNGSHSSEHGEWVVEEEQLVIVELSGIIDPDYLTKCQGSNFKVLGIETEEPLLQLGSYIFTGEHKNMLGTAVVFEKTPKNKGSPQWKYKCHTDKKIAMQRAHLKPKQEPQETETLQDSKATSEEEPDAPT